MRGIDADFERQRFPGGDLREQEFLREIFVGSCRIFATVLGPGADPYHYDHFHLDLARHGGGRTICKPVLKFMPNLDPAKIIVK